MMRRRKVDGRGYDEWMNDCLEYIWLSKMNE